MFAGPYRISSPTASACTEFEDSLACGTVNSDVSYQFISEMSFTANGDTMPGF